MLLLMTPNRINLLINTGTGTVTGTGTGTGMAPNKIIESILNG